MKKIPVIYKKAPLRYGDLNIMGIKKLTNKNILDSIDEQRTKLGFARSDVSYQSDITTNTFLNLFKKTSLPKFNDLFTISNNLGISMDTLIQGSTTAPEDDPSNILYWKQRIFQDAQANSLFYRLSDKVALAEFLKAYSSKIENSTYKEIDEMKFSIISNILAMDAANLIFIYPAISKILSEYYIGFAEKSTAEDLPQLWSKFAAIFASVWYPKYRITHYLWKTIDSQIKIKYENRSKFLMDSGINTSSYNEYWKGTGNKFPTVDTVFKSCDLLGIESLDQAIRGNVEELPPITSFRQLLLVCKADGTPRNEDAKMIDTPHELKCKEIIHELRTLPNLACFLDMLTSISINDLKKMQELTKQHRENPFMDYDYRSLCHENIKYFWE